MASLQEDPAEDSLCLACFFCATTVQGLELDLRFCDGKLHCYYCCTASPYLPLDPLLRPERPRSSKKGRRNLTSKRAAICFFSVPLPHIEALPLSALSVPVCLSACQGCFLLANPFPETLFGMMFAKHILHTMHTRLA